MTQQAEHEYVAEPESELLPREEALGDDIEIPEEQGQHLSYSFSRRFGLLVDEQDDETVIIVRPDYSPMHYAEVRRFLGRPARLQVVDEQSFNQILQSQQEQGAASAMSTSVDGFDSDLDLHQLVDEISEPEDLLESADDAPIIRLINALLTKAIRYNASHIYI